MRWAAIAKLVDVAEEQRADGSFAETRTESEVYANVRRIGASAWFAARAAGLHADAEIQVRSCDYAGQASCEVDGVEYEVEAARVSGEWCLLTLKRRLRSG